MSDLTTDPTLDRLLRHMAWANAMLFDQLAHVPDDALALASPRNEWTVARIVGRLVNAAGGYAARLEGVARPAEIEPPATVAGLAPLAARCAEYDARLRAQAAAPDGPAASLDRGRPPRARSTVLGQSNPPRDQHRAQIAAALGTNGIDAIDLDALVWEYGDAEGLGA